MNSYCSGSADGTAALPGLYTIIVCTSNKRQSAPIMSGGMGGVKTIGAAEKLGFFRRHG
jgi:hypothetical protein